MHHSIGKSVNKWCKLHICILSILFHSWMDLKFYILPRFPIERFTMFNINISGYFQLLEILILNTHIINVTARFNKMLIRLLKNAKEKVTLLWIIIINIIIEVAIEIS